MASAPVCAICNKPCDLSTGHTQLSCSEKHRFDVCGKPVCLKNFDKECERVVLSAKANNFSGKVTHIMKISKDRREHKIKMAAGVGRPICVQCCRPLEDIFEVIPLSNHEGLDQKTTDDKAQAVPDVRPVIMEKSVESDPLPLLGDDALIVLTKENDDDALAGGSAKAKKQPKKTAKIRKERDITHWVLQSAEQQEPPETPEPDARAPGACWGLGAAQAAGAFTGCSGSDPGTGMPATDDEFPAGNASMGLLRSTPSGAAWQRLAAPPTSAPPPVPQAADAASVQQLVSLLQCTEEKARKLLDAAGGSVEAACDAHFAGAEPAPTPVESSTAPQPVSPGICIADLGGAAQVEAAPQTTREDDVATRADDWDSLFAGAVAPGLAAVLQTTSAGDVVRRQPPPVQPPPPKLPVGWRAVWSKEENDYYYWHVPTQATQWELPEAAVPVKAPQGASDSQQQTVADADAETPARATASQSVDTANVIEPTTTASPSKQQAEVSGQQEDHKVVSLVDITGCSADQARRLLRENAWSLDSAIRAHNMETEARRECYEAREEKAPPRQLDPELGDFMCTQNWTPQPGVEACLRLLHGEHVRVSWVDEKRGGWAYASSISEPEKRGYCPKDALKPAPSLPRPIPMGERLRVTMEFRAPSDIGGYLSVRPNDFVVTEHPTEAPCIWSYVSLAATPLTVQPSFGWVPVCALDVEHFRVPHPAG